MAKFGIRILALTGMTDQPGPQPIRQWMKEGDVDAYGGRGFATTTAIPQFAKQFDTMPEAFNYWRRQSTVKPIRDDGEPNRPLTAWTVEVIEIPGT